MTGARGGSSELFGRKLGLGAAVVLALSILAGCEREVVLPGERFDARTGLETTAAGDRAAADAPRAISLPGAERVADWPSRGYNTRNRLPHLALSTTPTEVWVADIGAGNSRRTRITADPVAAAGLVFTMDSNARVQATQIGTGAAAWAADLTPDFDRGGNISGGSLAVSGDRLYATTGYGEVVALEITSGTILWRQRLGTVLGAPTISGGVLYVVGQNSEAWALDATDGRVRWQIPVPDAPSVLIGGAAPAIADRYVVFPFPSGEVVGAFPQTGVRIWGTVIGGGRLGRAYATLNDITADPVVVGNTVYVGNQSGRVVALDARTGERNWAAREGAYSPVVVAGGSLFFVSDRNELIRLDAASGGRIWGTELPLYERDRPRRRKAVFTHYGPLLAGGQVVLASGDGEIRFFSPESGAQTGSVALRGGAASHPIVVDGVLLVVSRDGRLHAFR